MNEIAKNKSHLSILKADIIEQMIRAEISDGRVVLIPISWFPKLSSAPHSSLKNLEISPSGYGIHWPEIDEDISIKSFIS